MSCSNCGSELLLNISAKCSDACFAKFGELEHEGYVPRIKGLGGGDYINLQVCVACGQVQNLEPLTEPELREALGEEPPLDDEAEELDE
jgi:hypothetical protein